MPPSSDSPNTGNGDLNQQQLPTLNTATIRPPIDGLDTDLAMALRISEQEQKLLQEQLKREQEELEEVLRLSMEEKWKTNDEQIVISKGSEMNVER